MPAHKQSTPRHEVAIIGGGFSGTILATHLLRLARQPLKVQLIEREDAPGRGVAYRDQPECHLLNVRAEAMSPFPDQPDHFLDWLNGSYSPCHPVGTHEFVPRRIYGFYLQSLLAQAHDDARQGVSLEVHSDEAVAVLPAESGLSIQLRSGDCVEVEQLVLALGNPGPVNPPLAEPAFYSSPRYVGQAWSTPGLYSVQPDENLLLIGSGLTTLDWLAALQNRGHRGRIHVVSRRGLMPQLHKTVSARALSFDPLAVPPRVLPLMKRLRQEIEHVAATGGDWRAVIDALRPYTQAIWQRLPLPEQRRFLRHVRAYWEIHRHRAAPSIVETVHALLRSDQLRIMPGRLLSLTESTTGVDVSIRPRASSGTVRFEVDRVVNCTGSESNYRRLNHPLIRSLQEQGMIQPEPLGLGLLTDMHGALIDSAGASSDRLYTLGPSRKGQLWETTAVPELRVQAQALARRLLAAAPEIRTCTGLS